MPRVIESMTRISAYPYTIRVWRTEEAVCDQYDNDDLETAARQCAADHAWSPASRVSPAMLVETLAGMDRVSAVEVVHKDTGNGPVLYTEWP